MPATAVQQVFSRQLAATSITTTITASQAGSTLIACAYTNGSTGAISFADSAAQTWAIPTGGHGFLLVGYMINSVAGVTSVTFNCANAVTIVLGVFEYSGINAQDGTTQIDAGELTGTTYSSGNIVTSATDLILGFVYNVTTSAVTLTPNAPLAVRSELVDAGIGVRASLLDSLSSVSGTYANSGSFSSGSNTNCAVAIAFIIGGAPTITVGPTYTTTESTIVATWTTNIASDSNLSAGGKAAIDNTVAISSTSHQAIVTGLLPSTLYSCIVTSGGTSSSPQNVTTNAAPTRIPVTSVSFGAATATTNDGDILYNFLSNDGNTYMTRDDAKVPPGGAGFNQQLDIITNESTLAISLINGLSAYGAFAINNGTDGPGGIALSNKANGLFGISGSLFMFTGRHQATGTTRQQFYGNVIRSDDKGVSWSNFTAPTTFNANGVPAYPNSGNNSVAPFFFGGNSNFGWCTPVRYGADDGTLGYNTSGNGIDGGNAYVYFTMIDTPNDSGDYIYLGRIPRIQLFSLNYLLEQFWIGPTSPSPADFVKDSNWSNTASGLTKIYTNVGKVGWQDICFIPAINSYLLFSAYRPNPAITSNTIWLVMAGDTPAGPWTQIGSLANSPTGYYGHTILHRTATSNIKTQLIPLTVIYSSDFQNQPTFYHPTYSTLTLMTGGLVANTFVQATGTTTNQTSATGTLAYVSNVTSGNLLTCNWRYNPAGGTLSNITSTRTTGNWTIVYDASDGGTPIRGGWAYAFATSTGACTVSLNFSASVAGISFNVAEHNGPVALRASSAVAVTNEQALVSNAATAVAGDLQLGFATCGAVVIASTYTAGAGYTLRSTSSNPPGTPAAECGLEDKLISAGGSVTASFTHSENSATIKATVGLGIFTSVFIISGNAGTASATVNYTGTASGSVSADGSGNYSIPSLGPGSYTITPSKAGFTFSPTNSAQTITNANISGVNFTASLIPTGPPGTVTITMLDSSTVTLSIPNGYTATQFVQALRRGGGVWSAAPDPATSATWWPYRDWQKIATS